VNGQTVAAGGTATIAGIGTLTIGADGSYTFTPAANYSGPVPAVTYTVSDGQGGSDEGTLRLTVDGENDPPVVVTPIPGQSDTDGETIAPVDVSGSFSDPDGDPLTFTATGLPPGLTIDPATGLISGTIDRSASQGGPYTVTVTATDPSGLPVSQSFTWGVANPPPVAADDTATTPEDTPVSGNVLANDADPDGDPLSVTGFSVGGQNFAPGQTATIAGIGTLTIAADGSYTFTPAANYNGPVPAVTYTVSDGQGGTDDGTLTLSVTDENDPPVVVIQIPGQADRDGETIAPIDVSGSFSDPDGDPLTFTATGLPPGLTIDPATGVISGTIDRSASQGGPYTVTVTATDPSGQPISQSFTWGVTNPPPVATDDIANTPEDTPVSGNVLANDVDPDGDPLSVTSFTVNGQTVAAGGTATIAGIGTLTIAADGSYTFTPAADYNGPVPAATYTVSDGQGGTDTGTLRLSVGGDNDPPVVVTPIPGQADTDGETITPVDVSGGFSDPDGDTLTFTVTGLPPGLTIDPVTGVISGTIDRSASVTGPYTVTVTATDPSGLPVSQTFTWGVTNPAPVTTDDTATTAEDTPVSGNVLANDSDPDGDPLAVTGFSVGGQNFAPGQTAVIAGIGTLTIAADGSYTFTPAANYNGPVPAVTYTVSDGQGGSDDGTLTLSVTPANDPPVVVIQIPGQSDNDGQTIAPVDVSGSFSDPDGDALTFTATGLPPGLTIDPATGVISGTIDRSASQGGPYTVTVTASDGHGGTISQGFTWGVANPPPVATGDTATTPEDTPVSGNVLTNDVDPDGDPLTVTSFTVNGQTVAAGGTATIAGVGTLTIAADGSYIFTPAANYNGPVPVAIYTISDGEGGTGTGTLTLDITPVNDPPVGTGTPVTTPEDTPVTGVVTATDPDGDPLTFTPGTPPTHGTVTINPDGSYSYVPDPDYNGPDSFTVVVSDGHGGTTTITVPVTVTPVNDPPVGTGTPVTTPEDTPVTGVVTATDPDGDPLTFTPGTPPTHGTVTINPDGSYTYVPDPDYNGPDSFTVTVSDGKGGTTTITVPVTVTPVNDPPTGTGTPVTTPEGTPVTGVVTARDPDGDPLTFTPGTPPTHGTVTINPDGSYTYVPNPGFNGTDSFTVVVSDGHGGTTTITVPVTVTPAEQREEEHRSHRVPGPWFHKTFPELVPKQVGGIAVDGIVVDTANGLNGLRSIIPGITADGIVAATANTVEFLNNTPGGVSGDDGAIHSVVSAIGAWRPYSERLFGGDREADGFDAAPFLGGAVRYDGGDDGAAGFTVDTIVNQNLLYISVIPNAGEDALTFRITQADGSPLPSWLGHSEKGVLIGDRAAGQEQIDIRITATTKDGGSIEKVVRINMHSGEVVDITGTAQTETRASFLSEDLDFELDHGRHEADALVRALASRLDPMA
jgi:CshA-type fibril repeat protein/VCBS repeat-containing protein